MPRFFVDEKPAGGNIIITGDDSRHIGRSLRMAVGEQIVVCCDKTDYFCTLEKISDEAVTALIVSSAPSKEPNISLTLFQALPKLDKLEFIVQKAVELGASEIVPVMTKRCVSRPEKNQFEKKRERLERISLEAAKQSGRGIIPHVSGIIPFEKCIEMIRNFNHPLFCYEKGGIRLNDAGLKSGGTVGLLVGPEGGFEPSEAELCKNAGIEPIWLGDRILRCETAPIAAISVIMNLTDNI